MVLVGCWITFDYCDDHWASHRMYDDKKSSGTLLRLKLAFRSVATMK